ncbi:hypothetical protein ACPA9J_08850 [Pseudomonas aeruginosa]
MAYHDFAADGSPKHLDLCAGWHALREPRCQGGAQQLQAGVGADYHLGAVTVGVSYDYTGKTDFNADTFTAKVRYDF